MNKYILSEGLNVLVRQNKNEAWSFGIFDYETEGKYYIKYSDKRFCECIPYDRYPWLLGKYDTPEADPYRLNDIALQRPAIGDTYYTIAMRSLLFGAKVEKHTWKEDATDRYLLCEGLVYLNYSYAERACNHINQAINRARAKKVENPNGQ